MKICELDRIVMPWLRHHLLPVLLISLALACSSNSDDAITPAPDPVDNPALTCNYTNPFTHSTECKEYVGAGWDEASATEDCSDVFAGLNLSGDFSQEACETETAIGACITDGDTPLEAETWFLAGNAALARNACVNFAGGEWRSNTDVEDVEPQGELMPEALEALQSDDQVTVSPYCADYECVAAMADAGDYFQFEPVGTQASAGLILYPGGRVDPRAYAPAARDIAARGYLVAVVPMPDMLAIGSSDRANLVKTAFPDIDHWIIGGHSAGATAAGQYAFEEGRVIGLVLWASYVRNDNNLSPTDLPVLTLYGSEEDLAQDPNLVTAQAYLPPDARTVVIEGGTHAQFGYYGNPNDETPLIDHDAQRDIIVNETVATMQEALARASVREDRYAEADTMDAALCEETQRTLTGMGEGLLPPEQLATQWHESVSDFSSAKAAIDAAADPQLTIHGYEEPHPEAGRWAPDSLALEVSCKMRRHDRIEVALGLDLPGTEGTCRSLNEEILAWATAQLSESERTRYESDGVQLTFSDDLVASVGGAWLPQRPILESSPDGSQCSMTAPALDIPFTGGEGDPQDLVGVHYCKLLSHAQALYWLTVQTYMGEQACALPETPECPDPDYTAAGSCIFFFEIAGMHFCEEYSGPAWTEASAEEKCATRDGVFAPAACADREAETSLMDDDGEFRGTCVVVCGEEERTWKVYSEPKGLGSIEDNCPAGFIPAGE